MTSYFKHKTIWITGASRGIGASLAIALSKFDTNLVLTARNESDLELVRQACYNPEKVYTEFMDMSDLNSIEKIFKKVIKKIGKLDILINNAGVSQRSLVKNTLFDTEQHIMTINYHAVVKLSKLTLTHFLSRDSGQFVIMSSTTGKVGIPLRSSYAASKHALHGYFESLRAELADSKISISIICPASIKTDISMNALLGDGKINNQMDEAQKNGMPVEIFTKKAIKAIARQKPEIAIGTFRESSLVLFIWRFFPSLFRRLIKHAKVT